MSRVNKRRRRLRRRPNTKTTSHKIKGKTIQTQIVKKQTIVNEEKAQGTLDRKWLVVVGYFSIDSGIS